ncbi:Foie gras liver health family 1 domain containing protein [Tylopilus felleus]
MTFKLKDDEEHRWIGELAHFPTARSLRSRAVQRPSSRHKNVRFPPRKLFSPEDPSYASAHSPRSPITPSSPLYPDGLIWIRKPYLHYPLDTPDVEHECDRLEEERRRDVELSAEIAQRKKSTGERSMKLTVVLLASRRMLDDPSLDGRLSSALFVLSPVSPAELDEFVRSLQDALYEPAVDYYTSHSKRVRRKPNRHSQASSYNPPPLIPVGAASPRPLRPEGWTVRYEYKMACFAEFRGEDEVALKHYQDAYATLMIKFGSIAILSPRTKRRAEAKVLADTINFKIMKLYLYNNEHALALSHHNLHMRRFADFSHGWGIGEETFEYWSWMARPHRVLAGLVEQGSRSTLTLPTHTPLVRASVAPLVSAVGPGGAPLDMAIRTLGFNPGHALQHPGHYYYMAARCTEARCERVFASENAPQGANTAPGYANGKKVDRLTIVLELYTKAYELFKKYSSTTSQGRLTLWIVCRIAQTYYQSGKFELAIRFFKRIAKTYRRGKWNAMLRPLFPIWYACGKKLGDVELTVRDIDDPRTLQEDLLTLFKTSVPISSNDILVDDIKESEPILNTSVVFWKPEVRVGEEMAFQVTLAVPENATISELPIHSFSISFSEGYMPIIIHHDHLQNSNQCGLGQVRREKAVEVILTGTIALDVPGVSNIVVTLKQGSWTIDVPHEPFSSLPSSVRPMFFIPVMRGDPSSVIVRHCPHQFSMLISHQEPALLDEVYPIVIEITNTDDWTLDVVDVLLQPTEADGKSSGLIKGVQFGTLKTGVSVVKTLTLISSGAPGDRTIDVSVQSSMTLRPGDTETLRTLLILTLSTFVFRQDITYQRSLQPAPGLADLSAFGGPHREACVGGEAVVTTVVECTAPCGVEVEKVALRRVVHPASTQMPYADRESVEYLTGDQFSDICPIALTSTEDDTARDDVLVGILSTGHYGPPSSTRISLPFLRPPRETLVALLSVPATTPVPMHLTVRSPHGGLISIVLSRRTGTGRLPLLLPGVEERVTWNLIPIECGYIKVPRVRVVDYRGISGTVDGADGFSAPLP